jgi:hypothetical protein
VRVMVKCGHGAKSSGTTRQWHTIASLSDLSSLRVTL